ncbi:hypothetical protein CY0110_19332 [Crocosphaera chwakensis CCY0110]|uniref:Uncharacterized protein n=1 Tax=Crocosphaera chwakensis CCY0110 TaxID=391612 RepID=A3IJJ8_9CHRO|nr:hypothetical protein CY0110_19332 [Crocosphaera chwakensis CCY0110]
MRLVISCSIRRFYGVSLSTIKG